MAKRKQLNKKMGGNMLDRKPNRLKEYDYSEPGYYFITICTKNKAEIFGKIYKSETRLNEYGRIVEKNLKNIEVIYENTELDYYVIMPDHLHFIIIIDSNRDKTEDRKKMLLSKIIQQFKRQCTVEINKAGYAFEIWQRSYYDRIIRNEKEMYFIRKYIKENPLVYEIEKGFPENLAL
jgi:REP element-mobilizing transposase RayT